MERSVIIDLWVMIGVPLAIKDYKIIYDFMSFRAYGIVAGFGSHRRIKPTEPTEPNGIKPTSINPNVNETLQKRQEKSTTHSSTMNSKKFLKKILAHPRKMYYFNIDERIFLTIQLGQKSILSACSCGSI